MYYSPKKLCMRTLAKARQPTVALASLDSGWGLLVFLKFEALFWNRFRTISNVKTIILEQHTNLLSTQIQ